MTNPRKLSNYTVVYGTYQCFSCGTQQGYSRGCTECHLDETENVPVTRLVHVKAPSLAMASTAPGINGRFIAAFEGHITGLLG